MRPSVKYTFSPANNLRRFQHTQVNKEDAAVIKQMYGPMETFTEVNSDMEVVTETKAEAKQDAVVCGDASSDVDAEKNDLSTKSGVTELPDESGKTVVTGFGSDMVIIPSESKVEVTNKTGKTKKAKPTVPATAAAATTEAVKVHPPPQPVVMDSQILVPQPPPPPGAQTRSRVRVAERVYLIVSEPEEPRPNGDGNEKEHSSRPPMPKIPTSKQCSTDQRWIDADLREAAKLEAADTLIELPKDDLGRYVRPTGATVMRLLRVREMKWKEDPATKQMTWLECTRFVCNGSEDSRTNENCYAETPDRVIMLLMTSIGASMGAASNSADAERAYLNALNLDRDQVAIAQKDMAGVPRESLVNKGLYGTKKGALSWEKFVDTHLVDDMKFKKLDVAKGVYMKVLESGSPCLILRHSDDFKDNSVDLNGMKGVEADLKARIKMGPFLPVARFLGTTFERFDGVTGVAGNLGNIVLVRQTEKIKEMSERFQHLSTKYNHHGRVRHVPVPMNAIKSDEECVNSQATLLEQSEKNDYLSLNGCVGWIAGTRPDVKLAVFLASRRVVTPREWDMYCLVWLMNYLEVTQDAPLVLGGPIVDPELHSDASMATMDERRSIVAHCATTGNGSGAIMAEVKVTKCAVTSIFEGEVIAASNAIDTALYLTHAGQEMMFPVGDSRKVRVDNEAAVNWIKGSVSNKRSKHVDTKLYHARHMCESGAVCVEYVDTKVNMADILTKPLGVAQFRLLAAMILGHGLLKHLRIAGVYKFD